MPAFSLPVLSAPGVKIVLDGLPTKDRDRDVLLYVWTLSDGRKLNGINQTIQFDEPGDYSVELQVDDHVGVSNSVQKIKKIIHIIVNNLILKPN